MLDLRSCSFGALAVRTKPSEAYLAIWLLCLGGEDDSGWLCSQKKIHTSSLLSLKDHVPAWLAAGFSLKNYLLLFTKREVRAGV